MCSMGAPAFLFRAWKLDCEVDMKTLDVVALVKDCPEEVRWTPTPGQNLPILRWIICRVGQAARSRDDVV